MPANHETWMPLYIADYLGDTMHLTAEQHGAYLLLLMVAWKRGGHVPDDDAQLAQITRMADRWQSHASATVRAFFAHRDGMLWHGRVEAELSKAKALVAKKSLAGSAGAAVRWHRDGNRIADASATALRQQSQTDAPSQSPSHPSSNEEGKAPRKRRAASAGKRIKSVGDYGPDLESIWAIYPNGAGKKAAAEALEQLAPDQALLNKIMAAIKTQATWPAWTKDGGKFVPHLSTWLNGQRWEDKPPAAASPIEAASSASDWRQQRSTVESKGIETGIGAWDEPAYEEGKGESWGQYLARVAAAVEASPQGRT